VVYSRYVQDWVAKLWDVDTVVIAPPVELGQYQPRLKTRTVLCVGRFFVGGHSKRQDVILEAFLQLGKKLGDEWRLVLAGGIDDRAEDQEYLADLQRRAEGHSNIRFEVNVAQDKLCQLYQEASLFIHAAGFDRPVGSPEAAEHFGITTVEAMSYGCVPIVYADGGQTEIVTEITGCLWKTSDELEEAIIQYAADEKLVGKQARAATEASQGYGPQHFERRWAEIVR